VKIVPGGAIVSSNHDGGQFEPNIRQGQFNVVAGRDSEDTKSTGSRCCFLGDTERVAAPDS